jgi:two-component system response regulator DesR
MIDEEPMIKLLLVSHPSAVRRAFSGRLSLERDIAVVGEATDGPSAVTMAQALQPAVVLLDAETPDLDVPRVVHALRARSPSPAIVILTHNTGAIGRALGAGSALVVGRYEGTAALLRAIRSPPAAHPTTKSSGVRRRPTPGEGRQPHSSVVPGLLTTED